MRHFTAAIVATGLMTSAAALHGAAAQQPSLMLPSGGAGGQSGLITSPAPLANTPPPLANSPAALATENLGPETNATTIPDVPTMGHDRQRRMPR